MIAPANLIQLVVYDFQNSDLYEGNYSDEILKHIDKAKVNWLHINSLDDKDVIREVGLHFDLHDLHLEDIFNINELPKMEEYGDNVLLTFKGLYYDAKTEDFENVHISLIIGDYYILSFQSGPFESIQNVQKRIVSDKGIIRRMGADYLVYRLLDTVVDDYYPVIQIFSEQLDTVEVNILEDFYLSIPDAIYSYKIQLSLFRKYITPLVEILNKLKKEDAGLIEPANSIFFNDIYEHVVHLVNQLDNYREMLTGLIELNMAKISANMNKVMKTLTIVATIFIPLTFVVGIYGMNFDFMPELRWHYGYPMIMSTMLIVSVLMVMYMKSKNWF